jgi:probable phosphoglycerate mutase
LILVRHGATALDPALAADGRSDPSLSTQGMRQAERVAQRLSALPIANVFVTPLRRTAQTAEPLVTQIGEDPVLAPGLAEVHLGELERELAVSAVREQLIPSVLRADRWDVSPGAEAFDTFGQRVDAALDDVVAAMPSGGIAVVFTHGGVIAEACRAATGSARFAFLPYLQHASITKLRCARGRTSIVTYNDIAHLEFALSRG